MKNYILLTLGTFLFSISTRAQYVTIPDGGFAAYLQQKFPACMNGNQMDTTCTGIVNTLALTITGFTIYDLDGIQYFDQLDSLNCSDNYINNLPALPPRLTILNCDINNLNTLPTLPAGLITLSCALNHLTSLPALPAPLKHLHCQVNNLVGVIIPSDSLITLACYSNQLTGISFLPSTLINLNCGDNKITSIPSPLPPRLEEFNCYINLLTSLPPVPASITILGCNGNMLTSLPALPPTLQYITCSDNQLTSLPPLPPDLKVFIASNNPDLMCLPPIKKLLFTGNNYFSIANTGIKCLQSVIQHQGYIPAVDTMPICGLFNNPNGCPVGWNIQGSVYHDNDANCIRSGGEPNIKGMRKINLYQGANLVESVFTSAGNYSFDTQLGTYRVEMDTTNLTFNLNCKNDTILTISASDSLKQNIDFALTCKPGFDVGVQSVVGFFRPGSTPKVTIAAGDMANLYGGVCSAGISGTVVATFTGPAQYVGPAPGALTPASVVGKVITWNVADFAALSFEDAFNVILRVDNNAQLGQNICFMIFVEPVIGDYNPRNNSYKQCFDIRNSFDPNDKQAYPSGNTDTSTEWLTYTVRFQNTGTDTAIHIYLLDTLNNNVEATSFELLSASHKNTTQVSAGGIIRFNFPHIMLVDSNANEPLSHGYVQYKVKLKNNLPIGTRIENTASIYFDFNPPVATNTTVNTISITVPTGTKEEARVNMQLYPNPSTHSVSITAGFQPKWICVYDVNGRIIREQLYSPQIDISDLSNGLYIVELRNDTAQAHSRLAKM